MAPVVLGESREAHPKVRPDEFNKVQAINFFSFA